MIWRDVAYLLLGATGLWIGGRLLVAAPTTTDDGATVAWATWYRVASVRVGPCGEPEPTTSPVDLWRIDVRGAQLHLNPMDVSGPAPELRPVVLHRGETSWAGSERFSASEPAADGTVACRATRVQTRLERVGQRAVLYRQVHASDVTQGGTCLDEPMTCRLEIIFELDPE